MSRFTFIAALLAATAAAPSAFAHAHLVHATPAVGSTIAAAPRTISLSFSEAVVPAFTGLVLSDGKGATLATGKVVGSGSEISVPVVGALGAGTYLVRWHAVAVDTHKTQGSFRFTIAP